MALEIETTATDDGIAVMTLRGELTLTEANDLRTQVRLLTEAGRTRFVFDFAQAPFLDSAGLRVLVELYRKVQPEGGAVWIAGAAPVVRQTFEITRISTLLHLVPSTADALAQIRQTL